MKVPLSWLTEYVEIETDYQDLAHLLTMSGTEVGDIEVIGESWHHISVGVVKSIEPHPNADRLSLATVNLSNNQDATVVCGAPNLRIGQKIAFAQVGATLTNPRTGSAETLESATIRGVESEGMICSQLELGLGDDHSGILVLHADAPVGESLKSYFGDVIFDLELTPNRPDCLSVLGIAREIAALTGKEVHEPDSYYIEDGPEINDLLDIDVQDNILCPRYTANVIEGVTVGPSPLWIQNRLLKCGQRPINNVVDITNYVMLEYGQPLHAFNYELIKDKKIIVRQALTNESFITLDEVERQLNPPMLVIADTHKSVALAGIMGGLNTEMTEDTTTVLLESANFDPINTRRTSQSLRLRSESSSRFDKGLQPDLAILALRRATQLILQTAGGRSCKGTLDSNPRPTSRPRLLFSLDRLAKILGIHVPIERVTGILESLGFPTTIEDNDTVGVDIPYWRSDIVQQDDLAEEVARVIGYDNLPTSSLSTPIPTHQPQTKMVLLEKIKDILVSCGMQETISYSLTSLANLGKTMSVNQDALPIKLANPMSEEQEYLRTDLRSSILSTFAYNQHNTREGIRIFEIGRAYIPQNNGVDSKDHKLPLEKEILAGVMAGPRYTEHWDNYKELIDFYDAKGTIETFLHQIRLNPAFESTQDPIIMPSHGANIVIDALHVGIVGQVHPSVAESFEIDTAPVIFFELDIDSILSLIPDRNSEYSRIPRFPGAYRDLAILSAIDVSSSTIKQIIETNTLVSKAVLFDVYEGQGIDNGMRSMAYSILFQAQDRTLSGDEINTAMEKIIRTLERKTGATVRS